MNVQTSSLFETMETLPANSTLLLHEVSWAEYEDLLALLPDTPRFRLSYDQGTLEIRDGERERAACTEGGSDRNLKGGCACRVARGYWYCR